jgi:hypothetical protein
MGRQRVASSGFAGWGGWLGIALVLAVFLILSAGLLIDPPDF